jgi:hypothetical protein
MTEQNLPTEPAISSNGAWHSVEDRPLFTKDERGNWTCTEDGDKEFIGQAAILPNPLLYAVFCEAAEHSLNLKQL